MTETTDNGVRQTASPTDRERLDAVKGLAIFLMLWGHAIQYCSQGSFDFFANAVFKTIYSFHMPLFMLVSGYLFFASVQKRTLAETLRHRTVGLLRPIILCGILHYYLTDWLYLLLAGHGIGTAFDGLWLGSMDLFWFLWSVLACSLAVVVACKARVPGPLRPVLLLLGFVVVALFPNMHENLYMYPYFLLGFGYAKYRDVLPAWLKKARFLSLAAFPAMMLFYREEHYIYTSKMFGGGFSVRQYAAIDLFRGAIGLVGCVFALVLMEALLRLRHRWAAGLVRGLARLGEKSLQIYCLSVIFLSYWLPRIYSHIVGWLGYNILAENMALYNFVFTPCIALLYSFGLYVMVRLMEQWKISRVFFGK